jgi:8-oxo-dGTP diphosphatase
MKKELEVVAALIRKGDTILLCQRHAADKFGSLWEFPGGTVEKKETPQTAIEREIREEVGLEVSAGKLVGTFSDENRTLRINVRLFECGIENGQPQARDCQDFGFFNLKEAEDLNLAPVDRKILLYLKSNLP